MSRPEMPPMYPNLEKLFKGKIAGTPGGGFIELEDDPSVPFTPERLKDLMTLDFEVKADFSKLIERVNADYDLALEVRPDGFHLTIISPTERKILDTLTPEQIAYLRSISEQIRRGEGIEIEGVGLIDGATRENSRVADKGKKTLYIALKIPALEEFRASVGLPQKDFHITVGFVGGDIHSEIVGKNEKGKDVIGPIPKKADHEFDQYAGDVPEITIGPLGGQEKETK